MCRGARAMKELLTSEGYLGARNLIRDVEKRIAEMELQTDLPAEARARVAQSQRAFLEKIYRDVERYESEVLNRPSKHLVHS